MGRIFLTSDLHFCHRREFLYVPRGFGDVESMNLAIVQNWNSTVEEDDDVYVLGDLMLNDDTMGMELMRQLKGRIHLVRGNHDTDARWAAYSNLDNVVEMDNAIYLKYNGYHFYLSHYPTLTGNLEKESLKQMTCNLYGHTHQKTNFFEDRPYMYHVGVDSHNCTPVLIDQVIKEMQAKVEECKSML